MCKFKKVKESTLEALPKFQEKFREYSTTRKKSANYIQRFYAFS